MITGIILSACTASSSTARKEQAAASYELNAALIESGSYQFTVNSASPSGGRNIQLTSPYMMKARDGHYEAHLPYFGRAYSGGYGDSGGIEFNGVPEDLKITRNDNKKLISITFSIKEKTEQYKVSLTVGSSAYGNLVISSPKKQSISYKGVAGALQN